MDDFDLYLSLLECVYRERPERFSDWVARVILAAHRARTSEGLELQLVRLTALALLGHEAEFAQALLAEIRRLTSTDPLPRTAAVVTGLTEPLPPAIQSRIGWTLVSRLSVADQVRLVAGVEKRWLRIFRGRGWI